MKLHILMISCFCFWVGISFSQQKIDSAAFDSTEASYQVKTITLLKTTKKLNSTIRAKLGASYGATSKVVIPISIPKQTVQWVYSFSTADAGGINQSLQLTSQLAQAINNLSDAGLFQLITGKAKPFTIKVPEGQLPIHVYVTDEKNALNFKIGKPFTFFETESSLQSTSSYVTVNQVKCDKVYLCIQNISSVNAVQVKLEAVAIVQE